MNRPRRVVLLSLCWVSATVACSDTASPVIALDELAFDVAFVFSFGADGEFIGQAGPIVLGEGLEGPTKVDLDIGEQVVAAGWTIAELEAAAPRFEPSRVAGLEFVTGDVSACPNGRIDGAGQTLELALPPTDFFLVGSDVSPAPAPQSLTNAISSSAVLRFEVDAEHCPGTDDRTFGPFATELLPMPAGTMVGNRVTDTPGVRLQGLAWVDDDRVAALAVNWLMLVERGRPFVPDVRRAAFLAGASGASVAVHELSSTATAGSTRVVVVGRSANPNVGVVWDFDVVADGLELVETTPYSVGFEDVVINPENGHVVALAITGDVYTQARRGEMLQRVPSVLPDTGSGTTLSRTGWSDPAYAAGGSERGVLMLGNPTGDTWTQANIGLNAGVRYKGLGFSSGPAGRRLWIGSNQGNVLSLEEGADRVVTHEMLLPPTFDCGSPEATCGWLRNSPSAVRRFASATRGGAESVYIGISACAGVIETRIDGTCSTFLRFPGEPTRPGVDEGGSSLDFRELAERNGWLALAARTGGLYVARVGD